jgi:acetolactate synthase-1/2/3 large subunit
MENYGTIQTLIRVMNAYGVEHVFFNPGIDNVPLLETIAAYRAMGEPCPRGILCLDEFVAMTAAHGNYMATGRPQVVSVHSELGVLQLGGSLHNAQWGRVPVVFFTENQGPSQRTTWRGDAFDQNGMIRNFVKWDHELAPGDSLVEVLNEAFSIATTEPYGPVYLNLPRATLWDKEAPADAAPEVVREKPPQADPADIKKLARMLLAAEDPLIMTTYLGRYPETVPALVKLAETAGARVLGGDIRVNFPNTHPLAALQPLKGGFGNPAVAAADLILFIDYDMHYAMPPTPLAENVKVAHLDIDIVKKGVPLWNHPPDLAVRADSRKAVPALLDAVEELRTSAQATAIAARAKKYGEERKKLAAEWAKTAANHGSKKPITAHWLSRCIDESIDENTLVVNQTISPASIVQHQVHREKPGTLLSCAGGCIGWAPGAGLGVKLGAPDKTVVSLMGDGAFIYGCPEATFWGASFYHAPFLAIIFNNQGYGAIKGLFREKYDVDNMGADIANPPDYAAIAAACHAYGRTVKDPDEVLPTLKDCLKEVKNGRPAVLDVWIEPV